MADREMPSKGVPGLEQHLQCHSAAAGDGDDVAAAVVAVVGIVVVAAAARQGQSLWAWEIHSHLFLKGSQVGVWVPGSESDEVKHLLVVAEEPE